MQELISTNKGIPVFTRRTPAGVQDHPALLGRRCRCGQLFVPSGEGRCETCGAAAVELPVEAIPGRGVLKSFEISGPRSERVIVTICLNNGPVIKVLLREQASRELHVGQPMQSALAWLPDTDGCLYAALRFEPIT